MEETSGIIYLVRHCATENDEAADPVLLGQRLSYGLSAIGEQQATQLARYFANKNLAAIYSSPLPRAVRTAQVICNEHEDTPIVFAQSFCEVDMGTWEGRTYAQIMDEDGELYSRFLHDPGTYGYPDGEMLSACCRRAMRMLQQVAEAHVDEHVVIVSHKQTMRTIGTCLQGLPLHRARDLDQDPASINIIRTSRGKLALEAVNWTCTAAEEYEGEEDADSN